VEYFQRLGMGFGPDVNAYTAFSETVYKLELPRADGEMIDDALKLLRDYADGILLEQKEIDKERGVILSEKLARDSNEMITHEAKNNFAWPDSRISERLVVGIDKTLKAMDAPLFQEFYKTWYTPDRLILVVVGDAPMKEIEVEIRKHFGDMKPAKESKPDPSPGKVGSRGIAIGTYSGMAESYITVLISSMKPIKDTRITRDVKAKYIMLHIANDIIEQRLDRLARSPDPPFIRANVLSGQIKEIAARMSSIELDCKHDDWGKALAVGEKAIRQALQYGFTDVEIKEATAKILMSHRDDIKDEPTIHSSDWASSIVDSLGTWEVFTSEAFELELAESVLRDVTSKQLVDQLRKAWDGQELQIFISGDVKIENPEKTILQQYKDSLKVAVVKPEKKVLAPFAYNRFGRKGRVAERREVKDLGITQIRFKNNVRLNMKTTDFEANQVKILLRVGGGKLSMPDDKPGLNLVAEGYMNDGGLMAHSTEELGRLFAGRHVYVPRFSVDEDAFTLSIDTTPEDLRAQLGIISAYLIAPGFRKEAQIQMDKVIDHMYSVNADIYSRGVDHILHGLDKRFAFPKEEDLRARSIDEAKEWLSRALREDYLEISIVGDISIKKTVDAVAATLGALPERFQTKPAYAEERKTGLPSASEHRVIEFEARVQKVLVSVYWATADIWDMERTHKLSMLAAVFDDRLRVKVREELGDTYSPESYHYSSKVYTDFGYLGANVYTSPDKAMPIFKVMISIAEDIVKNGISEDEFDRAIKPSISALEVELRGNAYWLEAMSASQERSEYLDWARSQLKSYRAMKVSDVDSVAREYLKKGRASSIMITPGEDPWKAQGHKASGHPIADFKTQAQWTSDIQRVAPGFIIKYADSVYVNKSFNNRLAVQTHPPERGSPCVLARMVDVPKGRKTELKVTVSHHPGGNWKLRVRVDRKIISEIAVSPETVNDGWLTHTVDLSQYAGKKIKLQLENYPTDWNHEWAYWNEVKVVMK